MNQATKVFGCGKQQFEQVITPALERIASNPETKVQVTSEESALCKACKAKGPRCATDVRKLDRRVLRQLGPRVNQVMPARQLLRLVKGKDAEELERIKKELARKIKCH
ncbi:DUF1284 domain-containing protein [Candidatus Micrarchaeota archaeon]|nr:DUF1284 domain-containing protein [Candidatus Micrarchaeota archaeon]